MITIVICTLNLKKAYIDYCDMHNYKIIFVSPSGPIPSSPDNIMFLKDEGEGLGQARQLALKKVNTKYVCFWGDDNFGYVNFKRAIEEMNDRGWVGCSFLTRVDDPQTYLEKCNNIRWKNRFKAGQSKVIGTPWLYKTSILKKYGFTDGFSDDTILADKLEKNNLKQGYVDIQVYESNEASELDNIKKRFYNYGKSDKSYYDINNKGWGLFRKLKSILHPIICEFIPNIYYIPFYLYIVSLRYKGWLK